MSRKSLPFSGEFPHSAAGWRRNFACPRRPFELVRENYLLFPATLPPASSPAPALSTFAAQLLPAIPPASCWRCVRIRVASTLRQLATTRMGSSSENLAHGKEVEDGKFHAPGEVVLQARREYAGCLVFTAGLGYCAFTSTNTKVRATI